MKIGADFVPPEDLIVTMVNGTVVDPPILLRKGQSVRISFSTQFPDLDLRAVIVLDGYRVRPVGD